MDSCYIIHLENRQRSFILEYDKISLVRHMMHGEEKMPDVVAIHGGYRSLRRRIIR